jgi:hypothetical protein
VFGDDEGPGDAIAVAKVLTRCARINPDHIALAEPVMLVGERNLKLPFEDVDKFCTAKDLRGELALLTVRVEVGEAGHHVPVWDESAEALGHEAGVLLLASDRDPV